MSKTQMSNILKATLQLEIHHKSTIFTLKEPRHIFLIV